MPDLLLPAKITVVELSSKASPEELDVARSNRTLMAGSERALKATSAIPRPAFSAIRSSVKPTSLAAIFSRLSICSVEMASTRRFEGTRYRPG